MEEKEAFQIFEEVISLAKKEIVSFTLKNKFDIETKADKTLVTACDKYIDDVISKYVNSKGISVVSEEGEKESEIIQLGNYFTIDPIDGSLGYIDHVNFSLKEGDINYFLKTDLGSQSDFCLLLGIIENSEPKYACCYHYVTGEKILLSSVNKENCKIELEYRKRSYENAIYMDQREGEIIQKSLLKKDDNKGIVQATLGLKSLYTILNNHKNAITIHRVQKAGLWDILPVAVACKIFGGVLLDDKGNEVVFNKYAILPGNGATVIKGSRFKSVKNQLKIEN